MSETDYFVARSLEEGAYADYQIPKHLEAILPHHKSAILDVGCGFGQFLKQLDKRGFLDVSGLDASPAAVRVCLDAGISVRLVKESGSQSLSEVVRDDEKKYSLITLMHVLEHFPKDQVIPLLRDLRQRLELDGCLYIAVPNAQSSTGCYWAYEDWTHHTLFTAGSLLYVLKAAGFKNIEFLDPQGLMDVSTNFRRSVKRLFLKLYDFKVGFWNRVTHSSFHAASPKIYSYELKVRAT